MAGINITPSTNDPPLVLIIEDDRTTRLLLRRAMEKEGYRVAEASDGEQGLANYTRLKPDIVLIDAMMPVMDGFTCCRHLQAFGGGELPEATIFARTPVLMITSLDDPESVDRAFEVGASDFVTKPIHWAVLRQRVRRLIQQSQLYRQLEAANRELQRLATLDALTKVANRRRFDEFFQREWRRMMREQAPLSLILCDVDFFKAYNDTYGHQAGDDCLQLVAAAICEAVKRPGDLVARYGGEEFAVILPRTDAIGAVVVAEEIRTKVAGLQIAHNSSTVKNFVTLSLGVACTVPSPDSSCEQLLEQADKALYEAKAGGRDRVQLL
ncbi:MAG: PleD family two-component system response regulator [Oscillatoriaceae bacterium SKW80]|nr:PleD family two-component system response regulator [Oscillatoriaceae bacterium SKYG93]MCX8119718.1 PleD family two-component system response regulator [Oscillatoriaceae bacterium SKW80]MDW8452405.1 PleD family two-component system response regulator [Oscillatoriaceae cyanobacterium SKYGB_i_bin93]HIK27622.1 PleD family two-component system response regulator [Oscillatoriaceae cyanobacterium M7585_C2015_266]